MLSTSCRLGLWTLLVSLGLTSIGPAFAAPPALRFRLASDPVTLDWNLASTTLETYIIMNVMEGLVEEGNDLKPQAALAERWEVSPDGKVYTFYLREGVKWSDGRPLKASDFEDSWFRLLDPKHRSPYANFLFDVENAEAFNLGKIKDRAAVGIKALGPSVFQVKLARRVPHFLHLATFWVTFPVRMDVIRRHGAGWALPGKLVSLGPYELSEWKKGSLIRLRKNPDYFGAKLPGGERFAKASETVEAIIEPDEQRARQLFEAGKLDFQLNATTQDLLKARAMANAPGAAGKTPARAEQYPYLATYYLLFNVNAGPLRNVEVRRAIAQALDREAIPALLQGGQVPARSLLPPGIEGHSDAAALPASSLYEARASLTRAGFPEGNRFPKLSLTLSRFDGAEALGRWIAKSLHDRLGIDVEPRFPASGQSLRQTPADLYVTSWGADYPDAENFLSVFANSASAPSGANYGGWKNSDYDALVQRAKQASDAGERLSLYGQAEKVLLQQDIALVPLFFRKNTVLVGSRVQDFSISPLNYLFLKKVTLR